MTKGKKFPSIASATPPAAKGKQAKALGRPIVPEGQALLHELRVHQIELEMQNEELRSARVAMEQALARYTELFDFAPIGYATIRSDHRICDINHVGAQLLGKERSRLRGWRIDLLVQPSYRDAFQALIESAQAKGGRQSCELEFVRAGAGALPVRLSATVLRHAEPTVLLTFEDISERRQREQKLELTERALRDADRRKDEFLATLSHELRNPLAPIRNSVFVLERAAPGGEAAARARVIIERQVTHLTRLIDDLLDITRIARGKIQLQREQLELGALLRRTVDDHRTSFEALGVQLESEMDLAAWVRADAARVVQITSNLLTNALKFTPRGGRVQVRLARSEEAAVLRIVDSGVGVPSEVLEHVFEPFAQAPQTLERARGGLGLGLAMVKGLVELHGGTVGIHSEGLGRGTEVTFSLPLIATPVEEEVEPAPRSHRARRVLVIEDNLDASETLRVALALNGHEVKVAHDGVAGLQLASEYQPEVVICDIGLPGMDGYAVASEFRRREAFQHTTLVASSGYAQPEDLERAREAGFHLHVAKPASMDKLEQLLANCRPPEPRGSPARAGAAHITSSAGLNLS